LRGNPLVTSYNRQDMAEAVFYKPTAIRVPTWWQQPSLKLTIILFLFSYKILTANDSKRMTACHMTKCGQECHFEKNPRWHQPSSLICQNGAQSQPASTLHYGQKCLFMKAKMMAGAILKIQHKPPLSSDLSYQHKSFVKKCQPAHCR
jgi:hypothetical protein